MRARDLYTRLLAWPPDAEVVLVINEDFTDLVDANLVEDPEGGPGSVWLTGTNDDRASRAWKVNEEPEPCE